MGSLGLAADDAAFAARVARLDTGAPVLVRDGRLWALLPFGVLACRELAGDFPDGVFKAADLGEGLRSADPAGEWRGRLPRGDWETIESLPAPEVARLDRQAADAIRARRGRGVGDRRLRDAMLDHVAVRVEHGGAEYPVQFRLVAALMRMGFLGEDPVRVLRAGNRVGLAATYGVVWERERGLPLL